jgi:hypothetical protein
VLILALWRATSKKMDLRLMIAPSLTLARKSVKHHAPVVMVLMIVLSCHCLSLPKSGCQRKNPCDFVVFSPDVILKKLTPIERYAASIV